MNKPTKLLAALPLLLLVDVPAAQGAHPESRSSYYAKKKIQRLAYEVADGARIVHRTASGRHGRFGAFGNRRGRGYGYGYGPSRGDGQSLAQLAELERRAHGFARAVQHRPLVRTHREFEALARSFDYAADALYRTRVGPAVERDFECLAEYMYTLAGLYEEYAYPRSARFDRRGYPGSDRRIEIYTPRWNVEWRGRGGHVYDRGRVRGRVYDRDWDSDWDSDSDSDSDSY